MNAIMIKTNESEQSKIEKKTGRINSERKSIRMNKTGRMK